MAGFYWICPTFIIKIIVTIIIAGSSIRNEMKGVYHWVKERKIESNHGYIPAIINKVY